MQGLRQNNRRAGVAAQMPVHGGKAEAGSGVMLESRGIVDNRINPAEAGRNLRQQAANIRLISKITTKMVCSALNTGAVSYCFNSIRFRVAEVYRDLPARSGKRQRNVAAQPFGRAGDKNDR